MGNFRSRSLLLLAFITFLADCPRIFSEQPTAAATAAFNDYVGALESRLARQHATAATFIAVTDPGKQNEIRQGQLIIERLTPESGGNPPGALLHHWRGTAFAPGVKAADFERVMRDFSNYPHYFAPEVLQAKVLSQQGDHERVKMRVRQHHVLTVVLDTTYDIARGRLDPRDGFSYSRSTQISEIASPGTPDERVLTPDEDHGFLWRLNTYWSYEERDGGLYMQIETVSLTRSIPTGLGWAVRPFIESVPRESIEFTLRAMRDALRQSGH